MGILPCVVGRRWEGVRGGWVRICERAEEGEIDLVGLDWDEAGAEVKVMMEEGEVGEGYEMPGP